MSSVDVSNRVSWATLILVIISIISIAIAIVVMLVRRNNTFILMAKNENYHPTPDNLEQIYKNYLKKNKTDFIDEIETSKKEFAPEVVELQNNPPNFAKKRKRKIKKKKKKARDAAILKNQTIDKSEKVEIAIY
ncbi:hypothetical protein MHBO_000887 [Bonamia ostreae]|uniref:Uncharacterized protein n=1 Tax=Bonamia ostreae TaxID=126728 RepID=A0ABV2AH32_9EUKA